MNSIILDASVLAKWFRSIGESHVEQARAVRRRFEAGELWIVVPPLLFLELLNIAARRWQWSTERLVEFGRELSSYGFQIVQPDLVRIAGWTGKGLTAYDACYAALAEERGTVVITDDARMIEVGGPFVRSLADEPG